MIPISGHTKLLALLGSPVSHSMSPGMHNEAFQKMNLDCIYLAFDVTIDQLASAVSGLKSIGAVGFNCTMPLKTEICKYLDNMSPAAEMIGAVNTVLIENNQLIGHNTDGVGFMRSVKDAGFCLTGKKAIILGAGGAATAICIQAALDGLEELHIYARPGDSYNRIAEKVKLINERTNCHTRLFFFDDEAAFKQSAAECSALINCTSIGMAPNEDACPVSDASLLRSDMLVADIIYNPRETLLLKKAKAIGCPTMNGLYMLLYQGAEAFHIWTGHEMPVEYIKEKFFS